MRNSNFKFAAIVCLAVITGGYSCTKYKYSNDPDVDPNVINNSDCNLENISFEGTIFDILQDNCIDCHNSSSPTAGYDYSDVDLVAQSAADGSLMGVIKGEGGYSSMPPGNNLTLCEINQVSAWMGTLDMDSIPIIDPGDDEEVSDCDPDTVYFQNTILPLIVSSCATNQCHDQASHRDGIRLTDYNSIITTGKIKAGDPNDSEFFEVLTDSDDDMMPPSPYTALTNEQVNLVKKWIIQGAKNNSCNEGCDQTNVTFTNTVWPMMQTYCAGCHNGSNPGGGISITNYNEVVALAENGMLMGTTRYEVGFSPMPKNKQLSDCKTDQLQAWIDSGFPQ